jgi:hypothetical protein
MSLSPAAAKFMRTSVAWIVGFLSVAGAGHVAATDRSHTSKIRYVYPLSDGNFVVTFLADDSYCTNGSSPKYYLVSVGSNSVTADGAEKMFAAALAAAAQGVTVVIVYDDSTTNCYINRLIAVYIG